LIRVTWGFNAKAAENKASREQSKQRITNDLHRYALLVDKKRTAREYREWTRMFIGLPRSIRGFILTTDGTDITDFGSRLNENREVLSVAISVIRGFLSSRLCVKDKKHLFLRKSRI